MDPNKFSVLGEHLDKGFAKAGGGKSLANFDVAPFVMVMMNDDLEAAYNALRPWLALYIGGMGAKGKNFYHDYTTRLGYGDVAGRIQDLYLSGKKAEAEALVPNELLDEVALIGSGERIKERLAPWKEAGKRGEVGTMLLSVQDPVILELLAKELL
jgi:alkanesulfonate monooxygenase SsuD/methylene tetrahydromethanopterin reductase-like flavin-dependent oxidoreductase (luciferase family)